MAAKDAYVQETLKTTDPDKKKMREKVLSGVQSAVDAVGKEILANEGNDAKLEELRHQLLSGTKDVFFDWLDVNRPPDEVFDNEIFAKFARSWEDDFFVDMKALNILSPDVLTRVSEYVPEIVEYTQKIIDNGYAYESNGSVYFDVVAFRKSPSHTYAKLVPEAVGDLKALQEGEGEIWLQKTYNVCTHILCSRLGYS